MSLRPWPFSKRHFCWTFAPFITVRYTSNIQTYYQEFTCACINHKYKLCYSPECLFLFRRVLYRYTDRLKWLHVSKTQESKSREKTSTIIYKEHNQSKYYLTTELIEKMGTMYFAYTRHFCLYTSALVPKMKKWELEIHISL